MTSPEELALLVRQGRPADVREALARLDEPERKALHPTAQALNRREVRDHLSLNASAALAVARVGTAPGAAATADVLRRRAWAWRRVEDDVVGALLDRAPSWLPGVVERLADHMDITSFDSTPYSVVESLRVAAGLPRPTAEPYLLGAVASLGGAQAPPDLLGLLRADAELAGLVPRALAADDVGSLLRVRDTEWAPDDAGRLRPRETPVEQTWPGALAVLSAEGVLDRSSLLTVVLESLTRGGKREHVAGLLAVHDALAPTGAEVAEHRRTYTRLVADGPGTVAAVALRLLRAAAGVGLLEVDGVLEAADGAVRRREKGLATAGLTWLQQLAKAGTVPLDEVALAVAPALEHERRDVQERGLRVLGVLAPSLQPETLTRLRAVAAGLPAVLRPDAEAALGPMEPAEATTPVDPVVRQVAPGPGAVVPPRPTAGTEPQVRDLAGLVEAVAEHLETGDPRAAERALDGVSRLVATDPDGFRSAMTPFHERLRAGVQDRREDRDDIAVRPSAVVRLLRTVLTRPGRGWFGRRVRPGELQRWTVPLGVGGCLDVRGREVAERVLAGRAGPLLAAPTARTGAVDPDAVLARLQELVRGGVDAGWSDLEQTLLRLPRGLGGTDWTDRVRAVGSPAAVWLAGQVERGLPEPTFVPTPVRSHVLMWGRQMQASHAGIPVMDVCPPAGDVASFVVRALTPTEPLSVAAARAWWGVAPPGPVLLRVLLTAPQHREVAAAHLLPTLLDVARQCPADVAEVLALLPEADGPTGPATALVIGWAAAGSDLSARTAAADALRGFAAISGPSGPSVPRGLDGPAAGRVLGPFLLQPTVSVARVAATLSDAARGDRPTQRLVWDLLATALPAVVGSGRRGVVDLLAVAAEVAAEVGARGSVDGLEAVARPGSTRLATEARRLRDVLAGTPAGTR